MRNSGEEQLGGTPGTGYYGSRTGASSAAERASAAVDTARARVNDVWTRLDLRSHIEEHPLRMLGVALGVGYVLGGGLFTRLTGRLVVNSARLGLRLAALPFLRDEVSSLMGSFSAQRRGDAYEGGER